MKRRDYVVLMIVGIVAMVLMPVAPCRANWIHLGDSLSSGPDTDTYNVDEYEYETDWWYDVDNGGRGGGSGGSWAQADIEATAWAECWTHGYGTSVSASASINPTVYGNSYFADVPNPTYDTEDLEYDWDVYAGGTVTAYGDVDYGELNTGDSVSSSASASGDATGEEYGGSYASGSVSKSSSGSAYAGVYGEATEDDDPDITETATTYYASLDFTVDAYDIGSIAGGVGNQYDSPASISAYVSASISLGASSGYWGAAHAHADVDFGGYAIVNVTIP